MRKIFSLVLVVILSITVVACGNKGGGTSASSAEKSQNAETAAEKTEESTSAEKKAAGSSGKYWIYPEADELVDIPMGSCVDGVQTEMFTVKMPKNYMMFFMYTDENGDDDILTDATTLDLILDFDQLDQGKVPSLVEMVSAGNFGVSVFKYDESWKQLWDQDETKTVVDVPDGRKCYFFPITDESDYLFIYYPIDDQWVIQVKYSGEFEKTKTPEEFVEQMMNLVTLK